MRAIEQERHGNAQTDAVGLTMEEWATALERSYKWTAGELRRLGRANKLVVGWRTATAITGRACKVPVYRLKEG